jgi:hypothetical protein
MNAPAAIPHKNTVHSTSKTRGWCQVILWSMLWLMLLTLSGLSYPD